MASEFGSSLNVFCKLDGGNAELGLVSCNRKSVIKFASWSFEFIINFLML